MERLRWTLPFIPSSLDDSRRQNCDTSRAWKRLASQKREIHCSSAPICPASNKNDNWVSLNLNEFSANFSWFRFQCEIIDQKSRRDNRLRYGFWSLRRHWFSRDTMIWSVSQHSNRALVDSCLQLRQNRFTWKLNIQRSILQRIARWTKTERVLFFNVKFSLFDLYLSCCTLFKLTV